MIKPDIVEVIGARVPLRKAGKEFVGPCPFHNDRHPSLYVNPKKGVFLCRACQERGDVFSFIQKLDGLSFSEACKALGVEAGSKHPASKVSPNLKAAALLADWLNAQYSLIGIRLRELSVEIALAHRIPNLKLGESLEGEWEILADLHDDLATPEFAEDLWRGREGIEALTAGVELDLLPHFPRLTESYRQYLRSLVC